MNLLIGYLELALSNNLSAEPIAMPSVSHGEVGHLVRRGSVEAISETRRRNYPQEIQRKRKYRNDDMPQRIRSRIR